jgi:DNA-binding MarR family transcriptional regulator
LRAIRTYPSVTPIPAARPTADGLDRAGQALFGVVRYWSRRWVTQAGDAGRDRAHDILVLEAVDAASRRGPVTIGDVATEVGLDRSGASRMVSTVIERGHATKVASTADGRRVELAITPQGRRLLRSARRWQDQMFRRLVADWPAGDARRFARDLRHLAVQPLGPPDGGGPASVIVLDHTVVPAADKQASAGFFARLVGRRVAPAGPFAAVRVNDDLTLDFDDRHGVHPGHWAFLVDDTTFDHLLGTLGEMDADYGASPDAGWNRRVGEAGAGRRVYVLTPEHHTYEFFTARP